FGGREVHGNGLAAVLDHGPTREALRGRRTLAVVFEDIERDRLVLADEFDRMSFHDDDIAAMLALRGTLCRGAPRNHGKEQCDGYALCHAGLSFLRFRVSRLQQRRARRGGGLRAASAARGQRQGTRLASAPHPATWS